MAFGSVALGRGRVLEREGFVRIGGRGMGLERQGGYGEVEQVRSYGVMKFRGREDLGLVDEEEIWGRVD